MRRQARRVQLSPTELDYFPLVGGLNLVTPPMEIPRGVAIEASNYEVDTDGGFSRIQGYERYDGRTQPHEAAATAFPITYNILNPIEVGDTVHTAAGPDQITGIVAAVDSENAVLVLTDVTQSNPEVALAEDDVIYDSGEVEVGTLTGAAESTITTSKSTAQYQVAAENIYRDRIDEVPGDGAATVWHFNGEVFGFRENLSNTAMILHKASAAGWVEVTHGDEVFFENGADENLVAGETLTQGSVTGTIERIVLRTGTLASGINEGSLVVSGVSGGSFAAGAATTDSSSLTLTSANTAISIPPNSKLRFLNNNFYGSAGQARMYFVTGQGPGFEFDGSTLVPFHTGAANDKPAFIAEHNNRLVLGQAASLLLSSAIDPLLFDGVQGAFELAVGADITNLEILVGSNASASLGVFTEDTAKVLYGSAEADAQLVNLSNNTGAVADSVVTLSQVYFLDALGARSLTASLNFGNFAAAQLTKLIAPWLQPRIQRLVAACVVRERSQVRFYFNDGTALYMTVDNERVIGLMPVNLPVVFNNIVTTTDENGTEMILAGGTDGVVYRLNKGRSCDGVSLTSYVRLSYTASSGPRVKNRYRKVVYDIKSEGYVEFTSGYELGYGDSFTAAGENAGLDAALAPDYWDSFVWDVSYWDGRTVQPLEQKITGTSENISFVVSTISDHVAPYTISGVLVHYSPRRLMR